MSREWQPGDVALVNDCTRPDAPWKPATCLEPAIPGERETVWRLHDTGGRVWGSVSEARPLVVIDPEDREQVARLLDDYWERVTSNYVLSVEQKRDAMQAALREFANPAPPKPAEPTGLGAVVEDAEGDFWVYTGLRDADDARWFYHGLNRRKYAAIHAVRVLSEGVH